MLAAIKIKDEPLDEIEESQEIFHQEEDLLKQHINAETLKQSVAFNNFRIVEEQDTIITVSAADMRSEEELRFINAINNQDANKFNGICSKCLKSFTNRAQFLKHTKRNHCVTKQKCPVCPVTFIDAASMLNHLNLHRENFFFCSFHCGANYATLSLCEDHEVKEHKIPVTPKIRYKHFCSFCREGFKTELQLHVHWLQQTQGCGKLMQDVVVHSTNVANNNDHNKSKNILKDKQLQLPTTNLVSTIPITKLRLKYDTGSTPQANKRQNEHNDEDIANKRLKTIDEIKTETESNELPFNFKTNIQIKEEPVDDYESNITSSLVPEVIIKTEEEDKTERVETIPEKPVMTNLLINNMIGPESNGKFIPLEELVTSKNANMESKSAMKTFSINNLVNSNLNGKIINMSTQNLPVLKLCNNNISNININTPINNTAKKNETKKRYVKIAPAPPQMTNKSFGNFNFTNISTCNVGPLLPIKLGNVQNNVDIKPLPKSGLQIIKFLPNTQIMAMKAYNGNNALLGEKKPVVFQLKNQSNETCKKPNSLLANKQPIVLQLKSPISIAGQTANLKSILTHPITVSSTITNTACPTVNSNSSPSNAVSIKLNSLEENTTIDVEDFKKLQAEALIKEEEQRKNFYIPKTRLMLIENIPEKKQIINDMKQQIAEVETKTTEQIQGIPAGNIVFIKSKEIDEPASLHLPILTTMDVPLVQARYKNPNYNYKWICPYCLKDYEIKTALRVHLTKAHNLTSRDMEKINVQAKPYKIEVIKEPIEDIKPQIKDEPVSQDIDSQTVETYETESLTAESTTSSSPKLLKITNTKMHRQRYVCDKCGRTCSSKTMLNDHVLANCSRDPQYSCSECGKKFFSHGTLQCHMTIHTGELPHKCNYCDKRFRTRGQVKVHHRTHTGERPFFCQVCSQRFTHRETLIAHLSRHIGMKRYKCYGCDKHFSCISALKTHREIRSDTCGKVKFNPRAIGPRVRVIRGNVIFEPQPEINPYLKSEDPKIVLSEFQNVAEDDCKTVLYTQSENNEDDLLEFNQSI